MKKVFTFFLAMAIIFGISGCGKKEYIVFPFSASDVVKIETYYSNSEADTKEKTLTEEADIDYLYTFFSELPVKDANSDSTNDGSTIKFVFDLSDGTNYELVYIGIATKKGYLQSETSDFYYFTSSDIIGVWANLSKMRLLTIPTIGNSLAQKTRGAAVIIGCRARVIFYSASESVMVNCASSNAASVMFCSLWIVCSASGRIAASISGSASEIAAIVLRQSCLW
jgi:predicted small lipoprotein YifL